MTENALRPSMQQYMGYRGLNLLDPDHTSPEEIAAFRADYAEQDGRPHRGFDFWFDHDRPDVIKRYRLFATYHSAPFKNARMISPAAISFLGLYGLIDFAEGIRYTVHPLQDAGMSKAETLEAISIAFLATGPRAIEAIAVALDDYRWQEPAEPLVWDGGWAPDPEAFDSGMDSSTPEMSRQDLHRLEEWYELTLGEIPRYVRFLWRTRPELLKAYRTRWENTCRILPKQLLPTSLLTYGVLVHRKHVIRENTLLCKAFGVSKEDTLYRLHDGCVYGGIDAMTLVEEVVGDVIDGWDWDGADSVSTRMDLSAVDGAGVPLS